MHDLHFVRSLSADSRIPYPQLFLIDIVLRIAQYVLEYNRSRAFPNSFEIDALSVNTAEIGLQVLLANGGEVNSRNGKLLLRIPYKDPAPPAKLEQIQWKELNPALDSAN